MRRLLICPTAFKGTLAPTRAAALIADQFKRRAPSLRVDLCPLADGGDGTLEVLLGAMKGRRRQSRVRGPLGRTTTAAWGMGPLPGLGRNVAVVEMAEASGLKKIVGHNQIMQASSYGTGQLIKRALDAGCRTILLGVGGTATGEGGAGALEALGLRYFDDHGRALRGTPRELERLSEIDWSRLDVRLKKSKLIVLCDVTNPLLGPRGSARTFGPQKGASPSEVRRLERMLARWSTFARVQTKHHQGAGAAGALAYGLSAFAGARLIPGTPFIMKILNWHRRARRCDGIVTGEGKIDHTSFSGKVVGEVAAHRSGRPVWALCGSRDFSERDVRNRGLQRVIELGPEGLKRPETILRRKAAELAELVLGGE